MAAIRILLMIVDPTVLEKFRDLLRQQKEELQVAGEASMGSAGLDLAEKLKPDLILVDLDLLRDAGFELIRQLKEIASPVKVLVLRHRKDPLLFRELIASKVVGVIEKDETPGRILQTIRRTAAGEDTVRHLFANLPPGYDFGYDWSAFQLTPRETDVMRLALSGQSNQNIGVSLGISENTVEKYMYAIYCKIMLRNTLY